MHILRGSVFLSHFNKAWSQFRLKGRSKLNVLSDVTGE